MHSSYIICYDTGLLYTKPGLITHAMRLSPIVFKIKCFSPWNHSGLDIICDVCIKCLYGESCAVLRHNCPCTITLSLS